MINLYNTAERKKVPLEKSEQITVYTCGPTVYLDPHIGNWRAFIFYDTLIRTLRANGLEVQHVINITDVGHLVSDADEGDDKLDKQAKEQRKTAWEIAEEYTQRYLDGRKMLNMLTPTEMPKATETINQQIEFIETLEKKGYTYQIDDGIYFDTSKFADYGKMAKINVEGQEEGSRVSKNDQKLNPSDFALWKLSPKDSKRDMEWDSPWGKGFPGWHLECSTMAKMYLGDTIDIHAGGIDHIPIHHTNEIAQSEAANEAPFSKIWMHNEFMMVNGKKMAKSDNNFYTLNDIVERGFNPLAFRLLVLQGHYRTETSFSWDNLESAQSRLIDMQNFAALRYQTTDDEYVDNLKQKISDAKSRILEKLNNDLNSPQALAELSTLIQLIETNGLPSSATEDFSKLLEFLDAVFGLNLSKVEDIDSEKKNLIFKRQQARQNKDFAESDIIRDQLLKSGIELKDSSNRQIWSRV